MRGCHAGGRRLLSFGCDISEPARDSSISVLLERNGKTFLFEMNMGTPDVKDLHREIPLSSGLREATIVDVGNPQCAVFTDNFAFDWRAVGAEIESHRMFPGRTKYRSCERSTATQSMFGSTSAARV